MIPFLYAYPNRFAPVRANGIRFHGYPKRTKKPRLIVIHTAENTPDYGGADGGAEAVARYQASTSRPSSYHEIVDSDSHVVMLPYDAVAFGARGANADGYHLSVATQAHLWPSKPKAWRDATVARLAQRAHLAADLLDVPVRRLTRAQIRAGWSGFASHADTEAVYGTPGRRSDPGRYFPWVDLLAPSRSVPEETVLKRGDRGPAVRLIQHCLLREAVVANRRDPLPQYGPDGDYGQETEAAVTVYQGAAKVPVTGRVDGLTAALLLRYGP